MSSAGECRGTMASAPAGRRVRLMLRVLLGLAASGCTTYHPATVSTTYFGSQMQIIGPAEGEARASYIFGLLGPLGDDRIEAAVKDALSKSGGDALINMTVDRAVTHYLVFLVHIRTFVSGTAVRLR